jgi:hypothetical protein
LLIDVRGKIQVKWRAKCWGATVSFQDPLRYLQSSPQLKICCCESVVIPMYRARDIWFDWQGPPGGLLFQLACHYKHDFWRVFG